LSQALASAPNCGEVDIQADQIANTAAVIMNLSFMVVPQ